MLTVYQWLCLGATSGIGRAVAHEIAQRGAIVVLACRNSAKAEELTLSIRKKSGNSAVSFLVLDLASLTSVLSFVDVLLRRFGYVDILINNAGKSKLLSGSYYYY